MTRPAIKRESLATAEANLEDGMEIVPASDPGLESSNSETETESSITGSTSEDGEDVDFVPQSSTSFTSASSSETDEDITDVASSFVARSGRVWSAVTDGTFRYNPAPTPPSVPTQYAVSRIQSVLSSFKLLITD